MTPPESTATEKQRRATWIVGGILTAFLLPVVLLAIFAPRLLDHGCALCTCVFLPLSAARAGIGAWGSFHAGAIFFGVLLTLSAGMLLVSTIFPLMALFP